MTTAPSNKGRTGWRKLWKCPSWSNKPPDTDSSGPAC